MSKADNSVANILNTGMDFTNADVYKYFKILRNYALNRFLWKSDHLPEEELRLIEWNIFHYGRCAMVRPRITRNKIIYKSNKLKIFQCAFTDINYRNGRPDKISIENRSNKNSILDVSYTYEDFVIFTDEYMFAQNCNPFALVAWEYACKLHELDLAFNANAKKQRMPFVFNTAAPTKDNTNSAAPVFNRGVTVAELMRSAFGRNEQFVEIPEDIVSKDSFMHEPEHVQNEMLNHLESQKRLYQSYMEMLGLYTAKQDNGAYRVKRLQEDGDDSPDFITWSAKSTRLMCAKEAALKFKINLVLEVV